MAMKKFYGASKMSTHSATDNATLVKRMAQLMFATKGFSGLPLGIFHQLADIKSYIGFVFVNAKFLADFVAYDVMAFQLDILTDLFAAQPDGIQT